jgi:hypothetical protein
LPENRELWKIFEPKVYEVKGHEGNCVMWRFIVCTFAKYIFGDQINQNGMDGPCDTHGVKDRYTQEFGWGTQGKMKL